MDAYKQLLNKVKEGDTCVMLTYLDHTNNSIVDKVLITKEELENPFFDVDGEIRKEIYTALETGDLILHKIDGSKTVIIEPAMAKPRLIVFGGGHVSKAIVEFSAKIGFDVTVIDDRPSFANEARFPDADKVICESFEKSFCLIRFRRTDFVVVVTRGHRYDETIMREVLKHDLRYVGMIGSKRRVKGMMEELLQEGYPQDKLNQVCAPIGLDIGAITPDEIGISIVAQLISYKNQGNTFDGKKVKQPEFDTEVFEAVIEPSPVSKALITILSAKGSVPRKAGAKMMAFFDGRTIGSIGGGCSEAEVLTKARSMMEKEGFSIEHVDMTGDIAESNGMVCGGVMGVLVEVINKTH